MIKTICAALLVLSVSACSEVECVESGTVKEILAVYQTDKVIKLTDDTINVVRTPKVSVGKDVCLRWEKK